MNRRADYQAVLLASTAICGRKGPWRWPLLFVEPVFPADRNILADSAWRAILEYFTVATHIGLTATPKETKEVSNIDYFGEPIYTYSLKQGIEDGFLDDYHKHWFTILEFKKATELFADPKFDGEPVQVHQPNPGDPMVPADEQPDAQLQDELAAQLAAQLAAEAADSTAQGHDQTTPWQSDDQHPTGPLSPGPDHLCQNPQPGPLHQTGLGPGTGRRLRRQTRLH
ncbi:hypothetical protein ACHHRT_11535 [Desulfurivibrio sp. D14AmB]|uniref:hypothetical protein n=1 Tax=Desulfurivibrio sp. D14AmB TaxID=3374370 RepID=UPI00376ECD3C